MCLLLVFYRRLLSGNITHQLTCPYNKIGKGYIKDGN